MSNLSIFAVFGSLTVVIAMVVAGAMLEGVIGALLLILGIVGCVAWIFGAVYLANAMNSDI